MAKKPGRNAQCPCGSGRKFKYCCADKYFQWELGDDGQYQKFVPRNAAIKDSIEAFERIWLKHLGRRPVGNEPMVLGKYLYSAEDEKYAMVHAMEKASSDPAHIYAYRKTGLLIVESALDKFSGAELEEWDEAIDEFYAHGGDPEEQSEGGLFDARLEELREELDSLIFLFGLTADGFFNTPMLPHASDQSALSPASYQALCVVRTHRTLKAIRFLLRERIGEDVLKLARSMYENYLHMIFIAVYPEKINDLVDAVIGLESGTHEYKASSSGKSDRRVIVERLSGRELEGHISAFRMAEATKQELDLVFFDFFYERTSQFLHPSVFTLHTYVVEDRLDATQSHSYEEGVVFSAIVGCMVADRLRFIEGCPSRTASDVTTVVGRIRDKTLSILDLLEVWQQRLGADRTDVQLLKKICKRLANGT